ncbi:hypothetical protein NITHO_6990002 [Nitrolancea hollandica Lb]|uniref:Uncharacterized protein n=1 Tax=Nitrolancea hollandica Lb TaxID=1129897 RepID=I4EMZ1_9BACT|nr:hypothetical protein NITHO_6990002 [Nitrolancea hollandica Lb]
MGTTRDRCLIVRLSKVHPHTRGDHKIDLEDPRLRFGSPPHAWGPLRMQPSTPGNRRFTPTRVGTTLRGGVA